MKVMHESEARSQIDALKGSGASLCRASFR